MLDTVSLRVLTAADLPEAMRLVEQDPVTNVFVGSRLLAAGVGAVRSGAEIWGYQVGGALRSLCYVGANVVPVQADRHAVRAFAARAAGRARRCSSIVGPAAAVGEFWDLLRASWGPARDVRPVQPLMMIEGRSPAVEPDPRVRVVRSDEVDLLMPACVAMFTEEVGVSPLAGDGGTLYRHRVRELVEARRAYAWISGGRVIFKAEVGAATEAVCQVQGVWVDPAHRGRGLSAAGMAAVVALARREVAPTVCLYVNDYNARALATYRRVGFREVGTFSSVLF